MAHDKKNDADHPSTKKHHTDISRRRVLTGLGSLAASAAWLPAFRIGAASAEAKAAPPPAFPADIELYQQGWENWSGEIEIEALWTCAPRSPEDVVRLSNWARANNFRLRPRGSMHGWAPFSVLPDEGLDSNVVLVDTTQHLTAMRIEAGAQPAVTAQAGAMLDDFLVFIENAGYGFLATPAIGGITMAGMLAINGHGTGVPAKGETPAPGQTYGSLSNLITALTAVVWDEAAGAYVLRRFDRSHPHCEALLTHLGRAFITEVTVRVAQDAHLRCQSIIDVPASELMAKPSSLLPRKLSSYLDSAGRAEIIWFPFTDKPWFKVWSVAPTKPLTARETKEPYNYPFSDSIPHEIAELADAIIRGNVQFTPQFGQMEYAAVVAGLKATQSEDLWGLSKNLLLYIKASTLRLSEFGFAVMTRRSNVQRVVSEFHDKYLQMVAEYEARGEYPINGPMEIRVTGLDHPADSGVAKADPPTLSSLRPRNDRPDWDVAVWLNLLTFPNTPAAERFLSEMEAWIYQNYSGSYAAVRPEWSKGWAYTELAGWSDPQRLQASIPAAFPADAGNGKNHDWNWARKMLNHFDPHRVFSNRFLDRLLP